MCSAALDNGLADRSAGAMVSKYTFILLLYLYIDTRSTFDVRLSTGKSCLSLTRKAPFALEHYRSMGCPCECKA